MAEEAPNTQDVKEELFARIHPHILPGMGTFWEPIPSRNELHEWLDRLYDERERFEPAYGEVALSGDPVPGSARYMEASRIYRDWLSLCSSALGRIREEICPTFQPDDPESMRSSLIELFALSMDIIPLRTGNHTNFLSVFALNNWLSMLDEGATPKIFKPNTMRKAGNREHDWWRTRYRTLMALWAIHLQARGVLKAAEQVAAAFGCSGNYHKIINRNVNKMIKAFKSEKGIFNLSPNQLYCAFQVALCPDIPDPRVHCIVSASLYAIVFNHQGHIPTSLEETGQQYREFERNSKKR